MPRPSTGDFDDDPEELYDDELLEDDEIDDDAAMRSNKPLSKGSLGDRDCGSDDDNAGLKGTNHDKGKSTQRRPPRPTRSSSVGRKVQGGGSMHRRRATRRVTPSDKKRSSSGGSPPITVRDIMGSEKKATAVGITHSGHARPTVPASPMKGSKTGAEEKRNMIRSRWKEKQNRQTDVKNSLAQFLSTESQSEDSDQEFLIDPEDEEIISDVDDDNHRPNSESGLDLDHDEASDDAKSVKSSKSQRRRRGSTRKSEVQDGEMQGSNHSRSRRTSRRRVKKPTGGSDDKSVGGVPSRKTTRHSPRPAGEDHDTTRQRPTDDGRSVDGDTVRRHRDADDGHRKTRSSSTRRKPSEGDGAKSRSTRRKGHTDDDERSVGSRKSVGGRRRRQQPSQRTRATSSSDVPHSPKAHSSNRAHDEKGSGSPLSSKPSSSSSVAEGCNKSHLLSKHIESATKPKTLQDLEERSEESSRFSANYEQPTSLLQFDPTNANNVKLVKQDKASMTSERIRNADGTESEFHISKLAGLPTFETSNPNFDSANWNNSASELGHQSIRSLGSVGYESDDHAAKAHKSMGNLGYTPRRNGTAHDSGLNQSGRNGRGVARVNTAGRSRGVTSSKSFQGSMKGLFGVWNKKGECESGDEDDDQPKGNRFFRKREDIAHQALDDDGSDEN